jgi:hypothetical protein
VGPKGKAPKTVIRAGAGLFYDRVGEVLSLDALRRDGIHQQQFVSDSPDFYPAIPSLAQLLGSRTPEAIRELDSRMRAPQMMQMGAGVERQLPKNLVISVNYLHSQGWHNLRSRNITAPLAGLQAAGTAIYLYEASGIFQQNQLIAGLNARLSPKLSFTGSYTFSKANSDTDGAGTFAADPYNLRREYSHAGFDIRHRVQLNGVVSAPWESGSAPSWSQPPAVRSTSPWDAISTRTPCSPIVRHSPPISAAPASCTRRLESLTWPPPPGRRSFRGTTAMVRGRCR